MALMRGLRYELKFLLRREQHDALAAALRERLRPDAHGDGRGVYPITSLYFDTPGYRAYWDKLDGHRNRRKVRVRVYGQQTVTPETPAFLEVKQRVDKRMCKRRVALPYAQAVAFDDFAELGAARGGTDQATLHEVSYLYQTLQLRPACVVAYERMAFAGDDPSPDLRVTLDTHLRGRVHDLSLLSTGFATDRLVLSPDYAVLEVKADLAVPRWLAELLAEHRCTFYRISKYCLVLEHCQAVTARQHVAVPAPPVRVLR